MSKPTCYYCREIGHTVMECVRVPPCTVCGKKGHKSNQCTYYVHKTAGKLYTQPKTAAKDVERKPKNSYAILNTKEKIQFVIIFLKTEQDFRQKQTKKSLQN